MQKHDIYKHTFLPHFMSELTSQLACRLIGDSEIDFFNALVSCLFEQIALLVAK